MRHGDLPLGRAAPGRVATAGPVLERLRTALPVSAVVLFGSRATGEHTQDSDYDLAVVSSRFSEGDPMFRRAALLLDAVDPVRGLDMVGLTTRELSALDSLLVLDVVADGIPLFDDGCFASAAAALSGRIASGQILRLAGGWRIGP